MRTALFIIALELLGIKNAIAGKEPNEGIGAISATFFIIFIAMDLWEFVN